MPAIDTAAKNKAMIQSVAPIHHKHIKNLPKKWSAWMQDFNARISELVINDMSQSAFERAGRKSKGKPFVFDEGNLRSLHFDVTMMQSAMWIDAPNELVFGYTKNMMGFLLANSEPKHILMIGLGGGSLAKFCYHYLPDTQITVVEIDADVIALRQQFSIPKDDERFQIIHMDAVKFIDICKQTYDVILLDGFDVNGLVPKLIADDFISACRNALNPQGILVTNMWGKSKKLIGAISRMGAIFQSPVSWCPSNESYNLITFVCKSSATIFYENLNERAQLLDQSYWLDFENLVGRLRTIPNKTLEWVLAPNYMQPNLRHFFFQEAIERKVEYLVAAEQMIKLTHAEWMGLH